MNVDQTACTPNPGAARPLARRRGKAAAAFLATCMLASLAGEAAAASSKGCEGGGFTVLGLRAPQDRTVAADALGSGGLIAVRGKYVEFDIDKATFGIRNYTLTAPRIRSTLPAAGARLCSRAKCRITGAWC